MALDEELAELDRALAHEEARLARLETDHLAIESADVLLLLRGPGAPPPQALRIEDGLGVVNRMFLSREDRDALASGGAIEVARTFVDPGLQTWEVALSGKGWSEAPVHLRFRADAARLTLVELDLSGASPARGAASLKATLWVHDPERTASR
jgi:hypothetical protein